MDFSGRGGGPVLGPRQSPAVHLPAPPNLRGVGGGVSLLAGLEDPPSAERAMVPGRSGRPAGPGVPLVTYLTDSNYFPLLPKKSHDRPYPI